MVCLRILLMWKPLCRRCDKLGGLGACSSRKILKSEMSETPFPGLRVNLRQKGGSTEPNEHPLDLPQLHLCDLHLCDLHFVLAFCACIYVTCILCLHFVLAFM